MLCPCFLRRNILRGMLDLKFVDKALTNISLASVKRNVCFCLSAEFCMCWRKFFRFWGLWLCVDFHLVKLTSWWWRWYVTKTLTLAISSAYWIAGESMSIRTGGKPSFCVNLQSAARNKVCYFLLCGPTPFHHVV